MTGEAVNAAGAAFKKALIEAALNAELSHHLGYEAGEAQPEEIANHRDGMTAKSVLTGGVPAETPRDRDGSFEPVLIPKHARRFTDFDEGDCLVRARPDGAGNPRFLLESYGTEVSADFVGTVTDGIQAEVTAWQNRPLEAIYPVPHSVGVCQAYPNAKVVFFDALRVKIRDDGVVRNKAGSLALGEAAKGSACVAGGKADEGSGATARGRSWGSGSRTPRARSSG